MNTVLVVVSEFNQEITSSLLEGAKKVLNQAQQPFEVMFVPGAYELPQLASVAVKSGRFTGVVALGCVIQGETPHFDYVCQQTANGLMQISIDAGVPVTFGVLTTDTVAQARARSGLSTPHMCDGKQTVSNKGEDAAHAVMDMLRAFKRVKEGNFL